MKKILVYGYGNPGRQDDGLGILLAEKITSWAEERKHENIATDTNYQLNIEDAYKLNEYDVVIYADASIEEIESYKFDKIKPVLDTNFTMHSVAPAFIVGLCKEIYNDTPDSYLLHIKGYEWEFMANPTEKALINLNKSFDFLTQKIESLLN